MSNPMFTLHQLGWRPAYARHLSIEDFEAGYPARVTGVHRGAITVLSSRGNALLPAPHALSSAGEAAIAVGDWLLVEQDAPRVLRLVDRQSLIARMAAGSDHRVQSIAANVDTLFVVTSCNDDFNPSRLERYLAVAFEAGVVPVIVLTKADICANAQAFIGYARDVAPQTAIVAIDATDTASVAQLRPWLDRGQTVAFIGSSGVGKSTLTNSLVGEAARATASIREDDARGRHTTTSRDMIVLPSGAWVIDTPGMRELRIGAVVDGLGAVFDDVEALVAQCQFRDCGHEGDVGCAVEIALADGRLDARRYGNYVKLQREAAEAARTVRERHERNRRFGVMSRDAMRSKRERQGR